MQVAHYTCDGMGAWTSYFQNTLLSGISIADLSTADSHTLNDTSIEYNNCSIGDITASFEDYNIDETYLYDQSIINDTFIVHDPSDTYAPIQDFDS